MLEQQNSRASHNDPALEQALIQEPEAAIERQPAVQAAPPAASFEQLTGQHEEAVAPPQQQAPAQQQQTPIADSDTVVEQLARGMVSKELDENDERFLATNGYRALPVIRGKHEFVMRSFLPTQAGKPPIVGFRGTVPSKIDTLIADVDPSGIGMYQFNPNRALIEGQVQAAASHGKIVSAGHSLGGALAQIAAATIPDCVERIVTFQAPGVSRETAQRIVQHNSEHPDEAIESSHHRVKGDLVPLGGEALTPGVIHNHEMTGGSMLSRNPVAKHTVYPLAQEAIAQGQDVPMHGDKTVVPTGSVTTEQDNEDKTQVFEMARTGLGHLVYGTGKVINGIGNAVRSVFE
jgi:hypothetical protein